jgi:hypothetical protein
MTIDIVRRCLNRAITFLDALNLSAKTTEYYKLAKQRVLHFLYLFEMYLLRKLKFFLETKNRPSSFASSIAKFVNSGCEII